MDALSYQTVDADSLTFRAKNADIPAKTSYLGKPELTRWLAECQDWHELPFVKSEGECDLNWWTPEAVANDEEAMFLGANYASLLVMFMARERFPTILGWVVEDLFSKPAGELERIFLLQLSRYAVRGACANEQHMSRAGREI